jgi:hypothetical protein
MKVRKAKSMCTKRERKERREDEKRERKRGIVKGKKRVKLRWIKSKRERERGVKRGEKEGGRKIRLERKVIGLLYNFLGVNECSTRELKIEGESEKKKRTETVLKGDEEK